MAERLDAGPVNHGDVPRQRQGPVRVHADGIMIAATASPGQRTLTIAGEKAPPGAMAVVVIRSRKTGAEVKYTVAAELAAEAPANGTDAGCGRALSRVMTADGLFEISN